MPEDYGSFQKNTIRNILLRNYNLSEPTEELYQMSKINPTGLPHFPR